jgi:hypothetical protein
MAITISGTDGVGITGNVGALTSGTAVTASGTSVDFTGIPSFVKRITVMFNGVSLNSTSSLLIQIGTSSGIENTGYIATTIGQNTAGGAGGFSSTAGFPIYTAVASATFSGITTLFNLTSNTWIFDGNGKFSTSEMTSGAGNKDLSAKLDRVRITTVSGTDTFDAGSINILYE